MSGQYFHFTLGPVQSFVAQARRTRDFWAGSFLLSYLAGVAMCATQIQGAKIIFPVANENFLNAITQNKPITEFPKQGGIPNRFMADIGQCENFNANEVVSAVKQAWLAICEKVWQKDKQGLAQNPQSQIIWQRQTEQFWDMSWVITDDKEPSALDKRKNFRTHALPSEDGYKCMVMEGFQELSGASDKYSGKKRRAYWQELTNAIRGKDIGENEQLCAIAYIKRRFVHIFDKVVADIQIGDKTLTIHGWKLPHNVPSVAYMASSSWLKSLLNSDNKLNSDNNLLSDFKCFIGSTNEMNYNTDSEIGNNNEIRNHILSIENLIGQNTVDKTDVSLDGNIYYQTYWDNINNFVDDKQNYDGRIDEYRPKVKSALKAIYEKMDSEPSPYYAILLMDGDSLGKQMSVQQRQPVISQALDDFTNQAQTIVRQNDGFLIYAGGDDVLALFSLDDAMRSAYLLQNAYKESFKNAVDKVKDKSPNAEVEEVHSTLSGAINYCHIGTPLTQVLMDSHQLLDDIAKDGTGRNALAVRVHKPSGQAVEWSLPWDKVMDNKSIRLLNEKFELNISDNTPVIEALALAMNQQKSSDKNVSIFSTGFFYKMRDLMQKLNQMDWANDEQASKLLLAEYLQSGNFRKIDDKQQQELIAIFDILLDQSRNYRSQIDDGKASIDKESGKKLTGDAGILLRILGQKGLGKGDK